MQKYKTRWKIVPGSTNYILSDDDDERQSIQTESYLDAIEVAAQPPPIVNVLLNHPHYRSWEELGLTQVPSKILGAESVCTADIEINALRVLLDVDTPFAGKVWAVADTGANIDCINGITAHKY